MQYTACGNYWDILVTNIRKWSRNEALATGAKWNNRKVIWKLGWNEATTCSNWIVVPFFICTIEKQHDLWAFAYVNSRAQNKTYSGGYTETKVSKESHTHTHTYRCRLTLPSVTLIRDQQYSSFAHQCMLQSRCTMNTLKVKCLRGCVKLAYIPALPTRGSGWFQSVETEGALFLQCDVPVPQFRHGVLNFESDKERCHCKWYESLESLRSFTLHLQGEIWVNSYFIL